MSRVGGDYSGEAFFARLPPHGVLPEEETLLRALRELGAAVAGFLPRWVSLQDWAARRVPAALAAEVNAAGLVYVRPPEAKIGQRPRLHEKPSAPSRVVVPPPATRPRAPAPPATRPRAPAPPATRPPAAALPAPPQKLYQRAQPPKAAAQPPPAAHVVRTSGDPLALQRFLASLPEDGLTPEEEALRQSVLFSCNKKKMGNMERLRNSSWVLAACEALLPAGVLLEDWIKHRLRGELEVDDQGVLSRGENWITGEPARLAAEATSNFFDGLPEDEFTEGELALRSVILHYMSTRNQSKPLTLGELAEEPSVHVARFQLMPECITLSSWLERRMGDDVRISRLPNEPITVVFAAEAGDGDGGGALPAPSQPGQVKRPRIA